MKNRLPAFAMALCLAGCSAPPDAAQRPPAAQADAVAVGVVDSDAGLVRILAPRDGITGAPLVAEGDHVAAGQALIQIDDRQSRLSLAVAAAETADRQAQAEVAVAKASGAARDARRLERLAGDDAATRADADQAATLARVAAGEQRQAAAALRASQARRELEAYEVTARDIRAPVAGHVVRRTAAAGAFVGATTPLFVIEPDGRRVVRAELDDAFADQVTPGMSATVTPEFQAGAGYAAQVVRVSSLLANPTLADDAQAKADQRVVAVILSLPPTARFRIGQKVLVRFAR